MNRLFIVFVALLILFSACKEAERPEPKNDTVFMFALLNLGTGVPVDFESDNAGGDFKPATGLLRIQAADRSQTHTIELTISDTGDEVPGMYPIGKFSSSTAQAKAEYLSTWDGWDARSTSGNLAITRFEETDTPNTWLLSGTFSFTAEAPNGEVEITSGEFQNAVIIGS